MYPIADERRGVEGGKEKAEGQRYRYRLPRKNKGDKIISYRGSYFVNGKRHYASCGYYTKQRLPRQRLEPQGGDLGPRTQPKLL